MKEDLYWEFEGGTDSLFIHFDVKDHFLKLDTFIQTAESVRGIIEALNENFFQGTLEYEVIVLPPEAGSFLSYLKFCIGTGAAAVVAFLYSDVGSAYVEGLTGKPLAEWAQEIGEDHRDILERDYEMLEPVEERLSYIAGSAPMPPAETKHESDEPACRSSARIVVAMTRGVLELDNDELAKIGMEVGNLPDALDARAEFYAACIDDKDVERIGFTPDADFPIPRNSFPERAQKPTRKEKEDEPPEWTISIESISVTSPNWDEEDQKSRQWKGKDQIRRDCYFVIEDAEFWRLVKKKDLHVEVLDNLKVQWACQFTDGKPKNRRVLRVLEFNGDKLAVPLTDVAIIAILGDYSTTNTRRSRPSLFDNRG